LLRRLLAQCKPSAGAEKFERSFAARRGAGDGRRVFGRPQNEQSPLRIYARHTNVVKGRKYAEGDAGEALLSAQHARRALNRRRRRRPAQRNPVAPFPWSDMLRPADWVEQGLCSACNATLLHIHWSTTEASQWRPAAWPAAGLAETAAPAAAAAAQNSLCTCSGLPACQAGNQASNEVVGCQHQVLQRQPGEGGAGSLPCPLLLRNPGCMMHGGGGRCGDASKLLQGVPLGRDQIIR
jgi:hypothetical protein